MSVGDGKCQSSLCVQWMASLCIAIVVVAIVFQVRDYSVMLVVYSDAAERERDEGGEVRRLKAASVTRFSVW